MNSFPSKGPASKAATLTALDRYAGQGIKFLRVIVEHRVEQAQMEQEVQQEQEQELGPWALISSYKWQPCGTYPGCPLVAHIDLRCANADKC
jgi:hypothetical protein